MFIVSVQRTYQQIMMTVDKNIFYNVDNESLSLVESIPLDLQAAAPQNGSVSVFPCVCGVTGS